MKQIPISKPKQIELAKQLQIKHVGLCGYKGGVILKQFTIEELRTLIHEWSQLSIETDTILEFLDWLEKQ